ncbi:MAG: Na/Pi symporter [Bacteroidota bacterium]
MHPKHSIVYSFWCVTHHYIGFLSAVIILAIVFINAGTLEFKQAIGILLGANVGTTFSSQLIALYIRKYAIVPRIIGWLINFFAKHERFKDYGNALFYFGMLFFGLPDVTLSTGLTG